MMQAEKETKTPLFRRLGNWLKEKKSRFLLALPVLLIIAVLAVGIDFYCYRDRIYPGVYLNKIPLGGLTPLEAEEKIRAKLWSLEKVNISGINGAVSDILLSDIGILWDKKKTAALFLEAGTGYSGYGSRLRRIWKRSPLYLEGIIKIDDSKLQQFLLNLAAEVEIKPQEARFIVSGAEVRIEKEINGRCLMPELMRKRLLHAAMHGLDEVKLSAKVVRPGLTAKILAGYNLQQVMVSFSSEVSLANSNRVQNINLGAKAINGALLSPGDIFSFEAVVGNSTREKGYREAPVIMGGKLVPGMGGGLCQVSSTLYNAALLANLAIVERYNHSLAIGYLPLGRDASISIGYADLKFKNTRDHHILIGAELMDGRLTFRLFGPPMEERVEIFSTDIVRLEPPLQYERSAGLPEGTMELIQSGKPGYRVKTWRMVHLGGTEISRELLSHDQYRSVPAIYRVGSGE